MRDLGNNRVGPKKGTHQTPTGFLISTGRPGTGTQKPQALSPRCRAQAVRRTERKLAVRERSWTNFFPLVNQRRVVMGARLA